MAISEVDVRAHAKWIGTPVKRKEDPRLITGQGCYVDDVKLPGMFHCALLRSPHAHARIKRVDLSKAKAYPGVALTLTGEELAQATNSLPSVFSLGNKPAPFADYPMAVGKVRYVGEPVAAVVAADRYIAEDALDLIEVEYDPLPAVTDVEEAIKPGAPLLFEEMGTNVTWHGTYSYGDPDKAFAEADRIIKRRLYFHRYSSTPLETFGGIAHFERATGMLTIRSNHQIPAMIHPFMAYCLRIPGNKLRMVIGDIGGGFGIKCAVYANLMIIGHLSMRLGRPVKWIEDRREHLLASAHGTERTGYVEVAVKNDGTILGVKMKTYDNDGGYMRFPEPVGVILWSHVVQSCYRFRNILMDCHAVVTNKCPVTPNRGYGRMQHQFFLERMMNIIGRELKIDPVEIRLKNFIRPDEFPYEATNGSLYDSGDYPATLQKALELIGGYEHWREEQKKSRAEGRYLGIGVVTIMDSGASNLGEMSMIDPDIRSSTAGEAAAIRIDATGSVTVALGTVPQGQSHETVSAQIVADELGLSPDEVTVLTGFDSATHPYCGSSGTYASRYAGTATGALKGAAQKLRDRIFKIAAHFLEARFEDLELSGGRVFVRGVPQKGMALRDIAAISLYNPAALPAGVEPGLEASCNYNYPKANQMDEKFRANYASTYANVAHAIVVELDVETGQFKILKYSVVHDAGNLINPKVADGQIHGGFAHSLGATLYEEFVYNEDGQLLTSTFMDYLCPKATEIPQMEIGHLCSPSPFTPYGTKGMGEGSGPIPALIGNAVEDALTPLGVEVLGSNLSPQNIMAMIWKAKGREPAK
ncbi:MAG: xanthine dehydrogenase family protein molybdopterin-binding subunit [Deltaproteobacteria bacterium]|nr:xanthine dehydrogenase family protein molybdopterin-binding subunit [Deltaproteobacteria bacterium]